MRTATRVVVVALGALAGTLTACGSTTSRSPASDGSTQRTQDVNLWSLVDASVKPGDDDASVDAFRARLQRLQPDELANLNSEFGQAQVSAYKPELWGAAYLINGGCSDDCFEYFIAWLVMQGSATFQAALSDPDSLADYDALTSPAELEDALYVIRDALAAKKTEEPPAPPPRSTLTHTWSFDDPAAMKKRYPKLSARFPQESSSDSPEDKSESPEPPPPPPGGKPPSRVP